MAARRAPSRSTGLVPAAMAVVLAVAACGPRPPSQGPATSATPAARPPASPGQPGAEAFALGLEDGVPVRLDRTPVLIEPAP